jgi:hypothetical protein
LNHSTTTPEPETAVYGFTLAAGNLVIRLGHVIKEDGVVLFATTQIADAAPMMWRQFTSPRHAAVDAAERLVEDAEEYAEATGGLIRPSEDLDFDDFVEHLSRTLEGDLN